MSDSQAAPAASALSAFLAGTVLPNETPKSNKLAIASLLVGCVGLVLSIVPFLGAVLGVIGGCLGLAGAVGRRWQAKSRMLAVIGAGVGVVVLVAGSAFTIAEIHAWHDVKPCNEKYPVAIDPIDNNACLTGQLR